MKKIISLIVTLALVWTVSPVNNSVYATDNPAFEYTVENSLATLTKYTGIDANVVIPETLGGYPVTTIGQNAFMYSTTLMSVSIPASVKVIDQWAFYKCKALVSVDLHENLLQINYGAFSYCESLQTLVLPESVLMISFYSFFGCKSLTSVTFGNNIEQILDRSFQLCDRLTEVTIPASVTFIGEYGFAGCDDLVSAHFLGAAPRLGLNVFRYCNPSFIVYYEAGQSYPNPWYDYNTAVFPGSVTPTPTNSPTPTVTPTVKPTPKPVIRVKTVKLNITKLTIKKGKTYRLKATIYPYNATNKKVTWKTGNKRLAVVSSIGKITAKAKGKVYITVTTVDGKKTARCLVTVK